jgi:DNA polymerase-3 subunit alpha
MCERVDGRSVNRKVLEGLIKSGACDSLKQTRATLFAQIERTLTRAASIIADRQRGQSSLFGMFEDKRADALPEEVQNLPEWPPADLLGQEKELLGFYVTGHPLNPFASILAKFSVHTTKDLAGLPNRSMTRIGGLVSAVQAGFSKKSGKPYAMVTLEDLDGTVQLLCMNESYDQHRELFVAGKALLVIGEVSTGDEKPKIFPQELMPLDEAPRRYTRQVHLRLRTEILDNAMMEELRGITASFPGKCPLFLCFIRPSGELLFVEANERCAVMPCLELQERVEARFGPESYYPRVDSSLPERQQRRWERRPDNGNGEG